MTGKLPNKSLAQSKWASENVLLINAFYHFALKFLKSLLLTQWIGTTLVEPGCYKYE